MFPFRRAAFVLRSKPFAFQRMTFEVQLQVFGFARLTFGVRRKKAGLQSMKAREEKDFAQRED